MFILHFKLQNHKPSKDTLNSCTEIHELMLMKNPKGSIEKSIECISALY